MAVLSDSPMAVLLCGALTLAYTLQNVQVSALRTISEEEFGEWKNPEYMEELFEGDMKLSEEQQRMLTEGRSMQPDQFLWPGYNNGTTVISYAYNKTINSTSIPIIEQAFDVWRLETCIEFNLVDLDNLPENLGQFIVVQDHENGCWSYVGNGAKFSNVPNPQPINLMQNGCLYTLGTPIHEIFHALGSHHEQSRSDRDSYVAIHLENVKTTSQHNFNKRQTDNHDVPYDMISVMHYHKKAFSINDRLTIVPLDPINQVLIGQRDGFSHMDKLTVNRAYGCINKWLEMCNLTDDPCQNYGYTGKNCSCVCPRGTTGELCDLELDYYAAMTEYYTPQSERITTEGQNIGSIEAGTNGRRAEFVKVITAPECHYVKYEFDSFNLRQSDPCTYEYLEIRLTDEPEEGERYCGTDLQTGNVSVSEGRTMTLLYYNIFNIFSSEGFSGSVSFIRLDTPECSLGPQMIAADDPCSFTSLGDSTYEYESPNGGVGYSYWDICNTLFETDKPALMQITVVNSDLSNKDFLKIYSSTTRTKRIKGGADGKVIKIPTANSRLHFLPKYDSETNGFKLTLKLISTDCHEMIEIAEGATQNLNLPGTSYYRNKVCEWWITVPEGSTHLIQMTFSNFEVGSSAANCNKNYVIIDTDGDRYYRDSTTKYCRDVLEPDVVTSNGGQLKMLFSGIGGRGGFDATVTTVPAE